VNVLIQIKGREAIPVRAIPLLTNWTVLAPDDLAEKLSQGSMRSYLLDGNDVSGIQADFWSDIEVALESLSDTMKAKQCEYSEWQVCAVKKLPKVAFVWRDEFEQFFHQCFASDNDSGWEYSRNLKPAILTLNFNPLVLGELETVIMEAFCGLAPEQPAPMPVKPDAGAPESKPQETARPTPLTTGDIAHCFALLRWNEQQWKDTLGKVKSRKWLQECVVIPGQRGVSETRWNPVLIGAELVRQGHISARSARAKFQTVDLLTPWLDEWKTYEADNLESD